MTLTIQGIARDLRCDTYVAYAQIPISEYLDLVGESFYRVEVQRKRQQHPAYARLKSDLAEGALIPAITLAADPQSVTSLLPFIEKNDLEGLAHALMTTHEVFILDGLQRTFILKDLKSEGHEFKSGQTIHVEIWLEKSVQNFIYRVLILNAGQKPMSARHQVKLIFMTIRSSLENEIMGLKILNQGQERSGPGEYSLDRMITAYLSFFMETPEISDDNLMGRGMIKEDLFNPTVSKIGEKFSHFKSCLQAYAEVDRRVQVVYENSDWVVLPDANKLMGSGSMLSSFFAGAGRAFTGARLEDGVEKAVEKLLDLLSSKGKSADPMGLLDLDHELKEILPHRHNVGYETRMRMAAGFETYFLNRGEKTLSKCWQCIRQ
jgi:hypothetical protein